MPFHRIYDNSGELIVDRTLTGVPPPPEPGVAQTDGGAIVGSEADITIKPGTFVRVTLPGPRERMIDDNGFISPRWYRFLQELYRRTGGVNDNVNWTGHQRDLGIPSATATFTGAAPSVAITHIRVTSAGSATFSSEAPTLAP